MKINNISNPAADVYNKYSKGPNTDPWGTPCAKQRCDDWQSSICTLVDLYKNQKKAWVLSLPSKSWKEMSTLSTAFYILLVRKVNCRSDYKKGMIFLY